MAVPVAQRLLLGAAATPVALLALPQAPLILATKFAVIVCGALIVTVVDAAVAFATDPIQLTKPKPAFGVALTGTTLPVL